VWWNVCERADWVEAFNGRPLIGDMLSFAKDPWYALYTVADVLIRYFQRSFQQQQKHIFFRREKSKSVVCRELNQPM
jgi:hypothetical protein